MLLLVYYWTPSPNTCLLHGHQVEVDIRYSDTHGEKKLTPSQCWLTANGGNSFLFSRVARMGPTSLPMDVASLLPTESRWRDGHLCHLCDWIYVTLLWPQGSHIEPHPVAVHVFPFALDRKPQEDRFHSGCTTSSFHMVLLNYNVNPAAPQIMSFRTTLMRCCRNWTLL